jgi:hypothetical protein
MHQVYEETAGLTVGDIVHRTKKVCMACSPTAAATTKAEAAATAAATEAEANAITHWQGLQETLAAASVAGVLVLAAHQHCVYTMYVSDNLLASSASRRHHMWQHCTAL